MDCGGCGRGNRDESAFCLGCGAKLALACPTCGRELPPDAAFCDGCGGRVGATAPSVVPKGARKVVTILFADLAGSTSMQERLDAEATARVMERVHRLYGDVVEAHGGRVVKTIGDGVMAVFGTPIAREDDAERAVRAGLALQAAMTDLAVPAGLRVGVNTGEVVVSPDSEDVVGDPVNVAARLESAAPVGGVLIGDATTRLVRDVVMLEAVEPLTLKGKAERVAASLVVGAHSTAVAATPFLGREDDLERLLRALDDAATRRVTRTVTVLGWPGLGKSRLAGELVRQASDRARVIEVRFVADGGSSFGPIAEAIRAVDPTSLPLGDDAERVASTLGAILAGTSPGSTEQVFWAIRRTLEAMAMQEPVVIVLDDLHWAEPAMLDLVEHLAEWLRGVPVLLLLVARPELRELRSTFVEVGGPSDELVVLHGLDTQACRQIALDVLAADDLPTSVLDRVLEASEGNPLFLRELVRLLVDDGVLVRGQSGTWRVTVDIDAVELPATIHAALAARIDQLSADEREVLQTAAVVGRHFARGAVAALLSVTVAARIDEHLRSLHRRALVDPEGAWSADEPLHRFHHVLIRDAAYRRVLKEVRADLHERYADWLAERSAPGEHDEVLGWHLEQAHAYRIELGLAVEPALAGRAAALLAAAGRRALDADDLANAAALLTRAHALTPDDVDVLRDRCEALVSLGDVGVASPVVDLLVTMSSDAGGAALADVYAAQLDAQRTPEALRDVAGRAEAAASVLASIGSDAAVAKAESVHARARAGLGQIAACEAALDRALAAARRAGEHRRANEVLAIAPSAALWGPSAVSRASGRCLDVVRVLRITTWAPHVEAQALRSQAVLEALRDRPDAARRMLGEARGRFEELGHRLGLLEIAMHTGLVELLAGQPAVAEAPLREALAGFEALGSRVDAARTTALLARALLDTDRIDEAEALARPELAGDDLKAAIGLLGVRGEVLARRGDLVEAETLARRAVALAEPTDALVDHADARLALANVLARAGRAAESASERARARELYEAKGASAGVRRATAGDRVRSPDAVDDATSAPRHREVRRNRAVDTALRFLQLRQAGASERLDDLYAEDWSAGVHRLGSVEESDGTDRQTLAGLRRPNVELTQEVLASLGDRHCLLRRVWRDPTPQAVDWSGPYEMDNLTVVRVDGDGRFTRIDTFDGAHLGRALACLYRRWAEDESEDGAVGREIAGALAVEEMLSRRDWEWFAALWDRDTVLVDRRGAAAGEVVGTDGIVAWFRGFWDATEEMHSTFIDVLGVEERGWALTVRSVGRTAAGEFETLAAFVAHYDERGRGTRLELFPVEDPGAAVARLRELCGAAPVRRVEPNAAWEALTAWAAAFNARDVDRANALRSPAYERRDHQWHHQIAAEAADALDEVTALDGTIDFELVASLGDRQVLTRMTFAIGDSITQRLIVTSLAPDGHFVADDLFDPAGLGQALSCLVERWAQHELQGAERSRGLLMARSALAGDLQDRREWDAYRALYEPGATLVDHRATAAGEIVGADAIVLWVEELYAATDVLQVRFDDVLACTPQAFVWRWTVVGERDGGAVEMTSFVCVRLAASGRIASVDVFAPEAVDEVSAWLDLASVGRARRRRVVENAAARVVARWVAAIGRDDLDRFRPLDAVITDHTLGVSFTEAAARPDIRPAFARSAATHEVLASLGDRHVLYRLRVVVDAAENDGGADYERLVVSRCSADGQTIVRDDTFELSELASALACLTERWAEEELAGPEAERARRIARGWGFGDAYGSADWSRLADLLAHDVVFVDHRGGGVGEIVGRDALGGYFRAMPDPLVDVRFLTPDILALTPRAALAEMSVTGSSDGVEFELPSVAVIVPGPDGRMQRIEAFPLDALEEAWSCFDRLDAVRPVRRVRPNLASALIARWADALAAGITWEPGPDYVRVHHDWHTEAHGATVVASDATLAAGTRVEVETLATLGERHGLSMVRFHEPDGGTSERLAVTRTAPDGGQCRDETFLPEDLDLALARLLELWGDDERLGTDTATHHFGTCFRVMREATAGRWDRFRAGWGDDAVLVDHRLTGAGEVVTADAIVPWMQSGISAGTRFRYTDVLDLTEHCSVVRISQVGAVDGSEYVVDSIGVTVLDDHGLMTRCEIFGDREVDAALARFDELTAPRREVRPNAASALIARWRQAWNDGDRSAAMAAHDERHVVAHHEWQVTIDHDEAQRSELSLLDAGSTVHTELLATLGERHALHRLRHVMDHPQTGSPVHHDRLLVSRAAADGSVMVQDDLHLPNDLAGALESLLRRWAEDEGGGIDVSAAVARVRVLVADGAVDAAFAVVDELPAASTERRVTPNAATEAVTRWVAAACAGDVAGAAAVYAPSYVLEEHDQHLAQDATGYGEFERGLLERRPARASATCLATLGERHALHRVAFAWDEDGAGGDHEVEHLYVGRVDGDGLVVREDSFSANRLDRAIACLFERWGADEAPPEERGRARRAARWWSFVQLVADRDWEAYQTIGPAHMVQVDHRPTGAGEMRGAEMVTAWIRELVEATDGLRIEIVDVLALTPRAVLWRNLASGSVAGGPFAIPSVIAGRFGPDGAADRTEMFPVEDAEAAWACFERFDATPAPPRRSAPNRATATLDESLRLAAVDGMEAVTPLYSPAYEVVRHDLHVGFDLATYRETEEWLIAETTVAAEVVVTLGDRHCLYRFGFTWPGDDSLGESTVEQLVVLRVDHDGRFLREDLFAGDRLLDAARCLAERWAEDERPGEASPIVDATLWSFYAALGAAAWDQIADVFTETAVVADRRPVSAGVLEGREAITAWTRAFRDGADAMHATVDDVLAIAVSAILVRQVVTGRASGAPFEANAVVLAVFADDGRVAFAENWSLDQLDEAWASWDRLAGVPRENRAVAVLRRWAAALLRGDRDEAAKTFAPDILAEDRRALVGSPTGDLVEARRQLDALADGGPFDLVVEPVETRGDDLGLCRIVFTTANDALVDTLTMVEVSDGGLMRRSVTFDGDDLESALAELDLVAERSTASTGDNAAVALVRRWAAAMSHRDVEGAMAMSAPDIVVEDRRPVVGIAHTGVEAARRVLASIIATGVVRVDVQLIEERGDTVALVRVVYGDEVAEVAVLMVATTVPDGTLVARFVTFEADDLDGARAELARLADRVAPENDAVRAVRRWVAAIAAGDVDLASAATTTWGVTDDRRPVVGGGRMRSHLTRTENEAIIVAGANEVIVEPLAARGDHLALLRMQFRSSGDDVVEVLSLTRLDPLSGRIAGSVVFAPDDVDAAGAELDRLADLEHNLALILLRRVAAAMSAGDVEAALALHTADVDHVDHRPLVGSDGGGHAWLRRLLDVIAGRGGVDVIVTPLSGPDDRTVLARSHFRIQGDAEVETLQVLRADEEGERLIAVHTFDPDDVDGATALLHRLVDGPS